MRSVVLLAYHYPPMVGPASERAAPRSRATFPRPAGSRSWSRSSEGSFTATSGTGPPGSHAENPIARAGQGAARCTEGVATARASTTRRSASSAAGGRSTALDAWSATTSTCPTPSRLGSRSRSPALAGPCERRPARRPDLDLGALQRSPGGARGGALGAYPVGRGVPRPVVADRRPDSAPLASAKGDRRGARGTGGRLGERGRIHVGADPGGNGGGLTRAWNRGPGW